MSQAARLVTRRKSERSATTSLEGLVRAAPRDVEAAPGLDAAAAFLLRLARALLGWGLPAQRVEESLERLGESMGIDVEVISTPTGLVASLTSGETTRTHVVRMQPGGSDLERLSALHELVGRVERKELLPADADQRLAAILARPPRWEGAPRVLAFALVASMSALLLGGGLVDSALAASLGVLVGALEALAQRVAAIARLLPALAATTVSVATALGGALDVEMRPSVVLLAAIIVLLPGLTVTAAVVELASAHLVSGTARLMGAGVTFLQLAFGVALGQKLGELFPHVTHVHPPPELPWALELVAPLGAALGLGVLLRARKNDALVVLFAVAVAAVGARIGGWLLGAELGAFVGAMLVTGAAHAHARHYDRPAAIVLTPGILFLVPGSFGFLSVQSMLENDVETASATGFRMLLVAMAIAAGTLVATAAVPPRRPL
jgi:uncharacterized membrane protein YjjP (DUF1212 family)